MSITFTIDFLDRTRAYVAHEAPVPPSGDLWVETMSHLTFCAARTFASLDRADQFEEARKWGVWLDTGFADFPVEVEGTPGPTIPFGRFVSSYDQKAGSYTRGTFGFGLNARGLDYFGPMATAVLLFYIYKYSGWDRPEDLLRPVRLLCERALLEAVEEASHVALAARCVEEAVERSRLKEPDASRLPEAEAPSLEPLIDVVPATEEVAPSHSGTGRRARARAPVRWKSLVEACVALVLALAGVVYLSLPYTPPVLAPLHAEEGTVPSPPPTESQPAPLPVPPVPVTPPPTVPEKVAPAPPLPPPVSKTPPITLRAKAPPSVVAELAPVPKPKAPTQSPTAPPPAPKNAESPPTTPSTIVSKDGVPMVLIPAGEFLMGSEVSGEGPPHRISLDAFYIDRYEVTNAQYQRFVDATGHRTPQHEVDPRYDLWAGGTFPPEFKTQPVVNVDWHDAAAYCEWAGKRLPTEAEWEKAARGTDGRIYPWGNDPPSPARLNFARRWEGPQTLRPVGSFEQGRSPYGAYDMAGNVWEWVSDWYGVGYYQVTQERNPRGPGGGSAKVLRGGSWTNLARLVRATHRYGADPEMRNSDTGFRCARDLAR
jgi:sulfatase modifying factor 1